jgi:outer membrane immunogenic protein
VLGLEGDAYWSEIGRGGICPAQAARQATIDSQLCAGGQATPTSVPYFTGGVAFGDIKTSVAGCGGQTIDQTGWRVVGGGVEAAITGPWTAKIEYLYVNLSKATCSAAACGTSTKTFFIQACSDFNFKSDGTKEDTLRSHHNPKILVVDDTEIVGDRIT